MTEKGIELSLIIPALNEEENIVTLLPRIHQRMSGVSSRYEIILVDGGSKDRTREIARGLGTRVLVQSEPGYGGALKEGFRAARGRYILTMDADLSHDPDFTRRMLDARGEAEIVVASRYVDGGSMEAPWMRRVLSRVLNLVFGKGLSLPIKDLSSGFRLYDASSIQGLNFDSSDFDILEEVLIKCFSQGWKVKEIPFRYTPRQRGDSHVKLLQFGIAYLRTFKRMWELRNSILSADYDDRASDSRIPFQRYWQRRRHAIVTALAEGAASCLDVGCGSSRILGSLDNGLGLDVQLSKLRYARKYGKPLVNASVYALPFGDESFDCVVCSQVIEHLPADPEPFREMARVVRKGGRLIIGTPDYARLSWRIIEAIYHLVLPGGYADEHITRYTREGLIRLMESHGFAFQCVRYICSAEMILLFTKLQGDGSRGGI